MSSPNEKLPPGPGLPCPPAGGGALLPSPYDTNGQVATTISTNPTNEAAKPETKKTSANIIRPVQVNRPQPKPVNHLKRPLAPRSQNMPKMQSATPPAPGEPARPEQRSLDYYKSTEDDDAAVLEARTQQNREARQKKKEEAQFKKVYGQWDPYSEYKLKYPTNLAAYEAMGGYDAKLEEIWEYVLLNAKSRKSVAMEEANEQQLSADSNPVSPPSGEDLDFAPPSELGSTSSSFPSAQIQPSLPVPQSADEGYELRLGLSGQSPQGSPAVIVPTSESRSHSPTQFMVHPGAGNTAIQTPAKRELQTVRQPAALPSAPSTAPSAAVAASPPRVQPPLDISEQIRKAREIAARAKRSPPPPPTTAPVVDVSPPPPPPSPRQPPALANVYSHTISGAPVHYSATISAPPVHYAQPPRAAEPKLRDVDLERPSKKQKRDEPPKPSKAELMMAKMGYVKGQGLGKHNDGFTTHLEVKLQKDKGGRQNFRDDFDDEPNGDKIKRQQVFDIIGGLRTREKDHGPFGEPSRVVVTWGCVDGVDLEQDANRDDGGIRQEMGDEFHIKFGNISRIHFDPSNATRPVYIEFQNELSALNAVNRCKQGYEFQGRKIRAQYYDATKFNSGVYDH